MISEKNKIGAVLALAFLLRVMGIGFGLPNLYHQDEPIIVNHAMAIGAEGWNPHFFVIPPFSIYLLFFIFGFLFVAGKLFGVYPSAESFGLHFLSNPGVFYFAGRFFLGVLFGTAAVYMVYKISERWRGKKAAAYASLFMATSYLAVAHSHYIYADCALVFFCLCMLWSFLNLYEENTLKNRLIFSFFIALAVSAKYTAIFFLPAYLIVYFFFEKKVVLIEKWRSVLFVGVFALMIFALLAPFTFLDWPTFWGQIRSQLGPEQFVGYFYHFSYSLANGLGWPILLLSIIGLTFLLKKGSFFGWTLFFQIIIYYGINIFFSQYFARYMLPLIPLFCILSGAACQEIFDGLALKSSLKNGFIVLLIVSNLVPVLYLNILFFHKDTRDDCEAWVKKEIPQGAVIVRDNLFFAPHLVQTPEQINKKAGLLGSGDAVRLKRLKALEQISAKDKTYIIYTLRSSEKVEEGAFLSEKPYVMMTGDGLKKIGAQYLIVNYSTQAGQQNDEEKKFLNALGGHLELLASFSPFRSLEQKNPLDPYSLTSAPDSLKDLFSRKSLGPYLEVYRIKDA